MPVTEEDNKKAAERRIEAEELELKKSRAIADAIQEENRKKGGVEDISDAPQLETFCVSPHPSKSAKEDWEKILETYKNQYKNRPLARDDLLIFDSKAEAITFFQAQAVGHPPRKFLVMEVDLDSKSTGFFFFSCGNSKLYQGSLTEIQKSLTDDLEKAPDDLNIKQGLAQIQGCMQQQFKDVLQDTKKEPEASREPEKEPDSGPSSSKKTR